MTNSYLHRNWSTSQSRRSNCKMNSSNISKEPCRNGQGDPAGREQAGTEASKDTISRSRHQVRLGTSRHQVRLGTSRHQVRLGTRSTTKTPLLKRSHVNTFACHCICNNYASYFNNQNNYILIQLFFSDIIFGYNALLICWRLKFVEFPARRYVGCSLSPAIIDLSGPDGSRGKNFAIIIAEFPSKDYPLIITATLDSLRCDILLLNRIIFTL